MTTYNITGTVTNTAGGTANITGTFTSTVAAPVVSSVVVVPSSAPAGTLRTITITATDPQGLALTYACSVNGIAALQTAGKPNVFTIIA